MKSPSRSSSSLTPTALQSFSKFSQLPIEIRLRTWAFAATPRPRVIQIFYDREKDSWHAWKDGQGGLPTVALTSREAYSEAMKPYIQVFDTFFNLKIDTLFISDPMFTLRKPRATFMRSQYAVKFNRVALSSDQYWGLAESHTVYPQFCPSPGAVLRDFRGLTTFTLVISEDGAGDDALSASSGLGSDPGDSDTVEDYDWNPPVLDGDMQGSSSIDISSPSSYEQQTIERSQAAEQAEMRRILDRGERDAMEYLSKGYFRHVGNIYLYSIMLDSDYWDYWETLKKELVQMCDTEKDKYPDWLRPNISFMIIRYGLMPWKECYDEKIHIRGDYGGGVIEEESSEYQTWIRSVYGDE